MIPLPGVQAVADHGALHALLGQRRLEEHLQAALGEFTLGGDPSAGRLWFASTTDPERRVDTRPHLVASLAPGPRSLLWGWAHPQSTGTAAQTLRQLGEQHGIGELTVPEVPFDTTATGPELGTEVMDAAHVVAAAAVEATGLTPYYVAPIGGGSVMVYLLEGVPLRPFDLGLDGAGIGSALMEASSTDLRASLLGLARHTGLGVRQDATTVEIADARGSRVTGTCDEQGRLTGLSMHLVPPA